MSSTTILGGRCMCTLSKQRDESQPTQTTSAIGSMEWLAEQKKSR
jgi:hypothetical protein